MAHLNRCSCGRTYRCEESHDPPLGVLRVIEERCRKRCPDAGLPGHDYDPYERYPEHASIGLIKERIENYERYPDGVVAQRMAAYWRQHLERRSAS